MRILHFIHSLKGEGMQNFLVALAPELVKLGNEVFVLVNDEDNLSYSNNLKRTLENANIKVFNLNRKVSSKFSTIKSFILARKLIKTIKPDIVNTHSMLCHDIGSFATMFTPIVHCCTIHTAPEPWTYVDKLLIGKKPLIYCSDSAYELRGQTGNPMIAINNGVDINKIRNADIVDLRKELGLNPFNKIVVLVGSLRPPKNYSFLIKVVEQLNDTNIHFCICGGIFKVDTSGSNNRCYISEDAFYKFKNIHLLGNRSDVHSILKGSDLYLSCSIREGLPISALEAFFSGIPCVLSPIIQHKAIAVDVEECYIPNCFTPEAFVHSIKQALNCSETHDSIYAKREIPLKKFNIKCCAKKYFEFYSTLLSKK